MNGGWRGRGRGRKEREKEGEKGKEGKGKGGKEGVRSPLLLNLFECFYHCFVLVGDQVILFVIHVSHKMFDSRYSIILLAITCSRSLQEIQVRDIGL
jgi:hypothetical protein